MAVAALVGEYGGDEDEIIAALLHDVVEDGGGLDALAQIRERFGERVERIVAGCSDAVFQPKPPWRERKEAFIDRVSSAPPDLRLVVAADKLHNVRSILHDVARQGDAVWDRFAGRRDGTLWYYPAVTEALGAGWSHPILSDLEQAVDELSQYA
jgi:GTP pyrophosphokinase